MHKIYKQTLRNCSLLSTVAVQWEDIDRWTHGTIVGKGGHSHNKRSYTIKQDRMNDHQKQQTHKGNTNHS